jgi:protein phosphatase
MESTKIVFAQDKGPRENLEDDFGAFSLSIPGPKALDVTVAVLADGVGGNKYGEVASAIAVRTIKSFLAASLAALDEKAGGNILTPESILSLLRQSLVAANNAVLAEIDGNPEYGGMSTTVVCGIIINGKIFVAWMGDSRCYVYRNGKIRQLTHDHSEIQPLVDAGLINEDEARLHPLSHAINRFVGMRDGFTVDTAICNLSHGDKIVFCSDGLTDVLSDRGIAGILQEYHQGGSSLRQLPQHLIRQALEAGTMDNISVLCCEYLPDLTPEFEFFDFTLTGAYPVELAETLKHFRKERKNVQATRNAGRKDLSRPGKSSLATKSDVPPL